ncbi:hypothetical protein A3F66_01065 [candidate division TM6 bacterium RIFCSPHIGHO2_12_FULL_32_22]|nr:MAG: hypothetical protein A3F66_01065 [candidate division TM6 bacterium RIFCSPHIGHO2_12_FULL_32_22]
MKKVLLLLLTSVGLSNVYGVNDVNPGAGGMPHISSGPGQHEYVDPTFGTVYVGHASSTAGSEPVALEVKATKEQKQLTQAQITAAANKKHPGFFDAVNDNFRFAGTGLILDGGKWLNEDCIQYETDVDACEGSFNPNYLQTTLGGKKVYYAFNNCGNGIFCTNSKALKRAVPSYYNHGVFPEKGFEFESYGFVPSGNGRK